DSTVAMQPKGWALRVADDDGPTAQERQECLQGHHERTRIAQRVIQHELTLLEAAAQFMELNQKRSTFDWTGSRHMQRGSSDDERCCRQVIDHVWVALRTDQAMKPPLVRQLERELRSHMLQGKLDLAAR